MFKNQEIKMPRLGQIEEQRRVREVEDFARKMYEKYGRENPDPIRSMTPDERKKRRDYYIFMIRRGGYDALARRVCSNSQTSTPGSRADRIQLIRERHRKLILEPR